MTRMILANQATAAKRRVYFHLVDATDGITAETGEATGQPQISTNGGAWTNTGIGTLTHIGNGRYYADLTQAAVATAGDLIETRFKSAATAETPGDSIQVVAFDPDDAVRLGLTAMPNAAADAAGGLPISDAGGLDLDTILDVAISTRLAPTVAARTLDVTAGGTAGIDWGNVESPSTAVDLSATDIQLCDTVTTNTDMRGTDSAALASVVGALADAAAAGDPTASDTVVAYIKQLINVLIGTTGVTTFPAEAAPANNVSLSEVIRAIHADVTGLNGDAMRGTDSAALATVCTEARLAELDAANLPSDIDAILLDTGTTLDNHLTDIKGTGFVKDTHSLVDIEAYVDLIDDGTSGLAKIATDVAAILVDTNSLNDTKLPDTISLANINAEVVDVMTTDTHAEPASVPAATVSLKDKIGWLYVMSRNKLTQTATTATVRNDADAADIATAAVSDDGTTFTRAEFT